MAEALGGGASRICDVSLCHSFDGRDARIEREQALAICDLLGNNSFIPVGHGEGPYRLRIGAADGRFALHIADDKRALVVSHYLWLVPFRRLLDMGRRGIYNQAADFPQEPLSRRVSVDRDTARRLFTLVYALLMRNAEYPILLS